ncbi:F-type H+-transporting ATPase subunit gamma [termite gut metagenome]|uniref:F-type H+-transporting ATPase subunit gamma n=1 Tax=termite gut metagenome TaxID=433724 RepID=A0A5J4RN65_9ZZZZ
MASLKEIKNRITSVKSIWKITSAMKMVAAAKLHKAQASVESMLPYQTKLSGMMSRFLDADVSFESAYLVSRPVKRVAIVAFSSNSSLCGAFNANVIRQLRQAIDKYKNLGSENIQIYPIGKKVEEALKKWGYKKFDSYQSMTNKPSYEASRQLAAKLMEDFVTAEIDTVELIYYHFKSSGVQTLVQETFLPLHLDAMALKSEDSETMRIKKDYIVEPSVQELITALIPQVLYFKIYTASLDSNASEHAARMIAMQVATENADELSQDLTIQYNKSRQQTITNELLDIIGGSM